MADDKKDKDGKGAKTRKPTALKRDIQAKRRNVSNRSFKSKVTTAVRALNESVTQKDAAAAKLKLNDVYSLMDKGVKKGIYKGNKANRVKSRLHALTKRAAV
jgi:small subunit ribosomal protein S20